MSKKKGNLEQLLGEVFEAEEQDYEVPVPVDAEDAGEMYGEALGIEHAADSDWATADPAEPLATVAEPLQESAPRIWDGALKPPVKSKFDELFDEDMLAEWRDRRPSYRQLPGRFDPFDVGRLAISIEESSMSTFLGRGIQTFKDALDHAMQICHFWAMEDEEADEREAKKVDDREEHPEDADLEYVEKCRLEWKDAINKRKEEVARLDAIVAEKRDAYRKAKAAGK